MKINSLLRNSMFILMALIVFTACEIDDFTGLNGNVTTLQPEALPGGEVVLRGQVDINSSLEYQYGFLCFHSNGDSDRIVVGTSSGDVSFNRTVTDLIPQDVITVCAFMEIAGEGEQMVGEDIPVVVLP